jgi:hypothetical protein
MSNLTLHSMEEPSTSRAVILSNFLPFFWVPSGIALYACRSEYRQLAKASPQSVQTTYKFRLPSICSSALVRPGLRHTDTNPFPIFRQAKEERQNLVIKTRSILTSVALRPSAIASEVRPAFNSAADRFAWSTALVGCNC